MLQAVAMGTLSGLTIDCGAVVGYGAALSTCESCGCGEEKDNARKNGETILKTYDGLANRFDDDVREVERWMGVTKLRNALVKIAEVRGSFGGDVWNWKKRGEVRGKRKRKNGEDDMLRRECSRLQL